MTALSIVSKTSRDSRQRRPITLRWSCDVMLWTLKAKDRTKDCSFVLEDNEGPKPIQHHWKLVAVNDAGKND